MSERPPEDQAEAGSDEFAHPEEIEDLEPSDEAADEVQGGVRKAGKGQQEYL
jgi:hypothetical protein